MKLSEGKGFPLCHTKMVKEYGNALETIRCTFESAVAKSHTWQDSQRFLWTITDFSEDDLFNGDGERCDLYAKST